MRYDSSLHELIAAIELQCKSSIQYVLSLICPNDLPSCFEIIFCVLKFLLVVYDGFKLLTRNFCNLAKFQILAHKTKNDRFVKAIVWLRCKLISSRKNTKTA